MHTQVQGQHAVERQRIHAAEFSYALHAVTQAVAVDTKGVCARLALPIVFAPTAQRGKQLPVAVLGQHFAQRIEQFVQGVVVAMTPQHHRQAITVEGQQA